MFKSVSVKDLAIDVFGCFRVLFPDAEIPENIPQNLISWNLPNNASQMIDRFADVLGGEVGSETGGEAFADAEEGGAGVGEGLDVALVGDEGGVAVGEEILLGLG